MKEYLLKELTGLVELTKEGVGKAVEVLQREAPELIEQILMWKFTISLAGCISSFLITLLLFCIGKYYWKRLIYWL
ncbi:hypothetical protein LCGC14_2233770 [marine sediment metagenome]|uniref:Uncharacterized protein n=1 Tax=marine sediment metagenome TaxID=412755 RepID=A0A0F9DV08_9ZZZZ